MSNNGQNNGLAVVFAFFSGFMAGAVISLLYAPNSGKETRQKIRDTSIEAKTGRLSSQTKPVIARVKVFRLSWNRVEKVFTPS